jgi:hypothetical protein
MRKGSQYNLCLKIIIFPIMPSLDVTNINKMPHFLLTRVINLINKNEKTHDTLFTYSFHFF